MNEELIFRPMRRYKQQLPEEECIAILKEAYRGFLSVVGEGGYPYTIPINFVFPVEIQIKVENIFSLFNKSL